MGIQIYRNNVSTVLAAACAAFDTTLVVQDASGILQHENDIGSVWQVLTLQSPTDPGQFEIVKLIQRMGGSTTLTVERGQEYTTPRSWTAGTLVQARVTAGMLDRLVENTHASNGIAIGSRDYPRTATGDGSVSVGVLTSAPGEKSSAFGREATAGAKQSTAVGYFAKAYGEQSIALGEGYATLPNQLAVSAHACIPRDDWKAGGGSQGNAGMESLFASAYCELGTPAVWAANTQYVDGATVRPTVPNGIQYTLWNGAYEFATPPTVVLSRATEPAWPGTTANYASVGAGDEVDAGGDPVHYWVANDPSAGLNETFPAGMVFYPTEVGFICFSHTNVTAAPFVSIGTAADPTLLVNNQQLSGITGAAQRHAFTSLKHGITDIKFRLETAATGVEARFHGRFYAKGIFIQAQG